VSGIGSVHVYEYYNVVATLYITPLPLPHSGRHDCQVPTVFPPLVCISEQHYQRQHQH
jgi:hypothetical protein